MTPRRPKRAKKSVVALPEQGKSRYVMVQIGVEVSKIEAEMASRLGLTIGEYMKRRYYCGCIGGCIDGNFNF
jgi:hypothetical protein